MSKIIEKKDLEEYGSTLSFPILKFTNSSITNKYLQQAIILAEHFMQQVDCRDTFQMLGADGLKCKEMIAHLKIEFTDQDEMHRNLIDSDHTEANSDNTIALGWTYRRKNAIMHINKMFERRLHKTTNEEERKIIVVYMAIVILHEMAHLVLRWSGISRTPEKCLSFFNEVEAGCYLESRLFQGEICSCIQKSKTAEEWNDDMAFVGIKILLLFGVTF